MKKLMVSLAACAASVCGLAADPSGDDWGWKITDLGEAQNEVALVFTNTAEEISWTIPDGVTEIRYLVVGGGGGGGSSYGGGGGGGGFKESTLSVTGGSAVSVKVGVGGAGSRVETSVQGGDGGESWLKVGGEEVAKMAGGGGGGGWAVAGRNGACGGGGSVKSGGVGVAGGTGSEGGNGATGAVETGGGGGGFTADGSGKNGGAGQTSDITGETLGYAGGGGGGVRGRSNNAGGLGQDGGGTGGGLVNGVYVVATAGVDGTGSGGGGGGVKDNDSNTFRWKVGAKGGNGVVVIRYVDPTAKEVNEFLEQPSVEPSAWSEDQVSKTVTINLGQAKYGTATCSHTAAEILALPVGKHAITFTVPETKDYKGLTKTVYVTVSYAATVGAVKIEFSGYTGTETLTNFPALVRISADTITGLSTQTLNAVGKDLRFLGEDGAELAHEIDTWDPNGESLVWVKVPELTKDTTITMHWGRTGRRQTADKDVWTDYAVVHHFSDATKSVCADSSGNGFKATLPDGGAIDAAKLGNGVSTVKGDGVVIDSYAALGLGGKFAASGWFYAQNDAGQSKWVMFFGNKEDYISGNGFMLRMQDSYRGFLYAGNGIQQAVDGNFSASILGRWIYLTVTCDGSKMRIYENGGLRKEVGYTVSDSNLPLTVSKSLAGLTDEIRVGKNSASADWVKAEYAVQKDASFATYTLVQNPVISKGLILIIR